MSQYQLLKQAIIEERPVATATIVSVPEGVPFIVGAKLLAWPTRETDGTLGDPSLDEQARNDALQLLARGENTIRNYPVGQSEVAVFIESFNPPPTLFMIGAVHIAVGLTSLAKTMGFRTVVIDARASFATEERFAHADELVVAWPDEALEGRLSATSHVAVLTHDPKLDDPALRVALRAPVRYIGALGSPGTHAKRLARLREEGFSEAELARIHGPIGLTIGAKTPEEIALSILAEIIKVRRSS
jgi:xanthine dehydrogenase accessory factor